jgi:hypothetical protein
VFRTATIAITAWRLERYVDAFGRGNAPDEADAE